MKFISLNHELSNETPGYGGRKDIQIFQSKCLVNHDTCNQLMISMSNHVGTHVDFPSHFSAAGKTLSDYGLEELFFSKVQVLDIEINMAELLRLGDWVQGIRMDTDLLLIKTGFEAHRATDSYWKDSPGIHSEVAIWILEHRPAIRAIGFDFISLTSQHHKLEGKLAHQTFLCGTKTVIIIEDMKLSPLCATSSLAGVHIVPLAISKADGAPATVIGHLSSP